MRRSDSKIIDFELKIAALANAAECEVKMFTKNHFRLTKGQLRVDFFPPGKRYHMVDTEERGDIYDLENFIETTFVTDFDQNEQDAINSPKRNMTIDSVMNFGKYKGTVIRKIPQEYLMYLYDSKKTTPELWLLIDKNKEELFS